MLSLTETDAEGRFKTQAVIKSQNRGFVVAKKPGLAMGWDLLSAYLSPITQANLLIVLEPACQVAGEITDTQITATVESVDEQFRSTRC